MATGPSRVVLITGGSSELLAARGHRVFSGVRTVTTARPFAGVEVVPLDVRDEASVRSCVEEVHSRAVGSTC